jgi:nucleoside-diphosphate-sugar epimerase
VSRVLVTGATGFIGRHALPRLRERGHEVHASYRGSPGSETAEWHRADLLDPREIESLIDSVRPSHLLHFAWYAEPGKFWTSPENAAWVESGIHLLRAFADAKGQRVVVSGSCAEYEWGADVLSERDTPLRPQTFYGTCKGALASIGAGLAGLRGFSMAWGRIFFVYGPHEPPGRLVSQVASALVQGLPAPASEGTQRRDFLHASDVADAFVALLDSDVEGAVNIGAGTAVPVREVVSTIAAAAGRPELVRWGEIPMRAGDPNVIEADVARLRDEVAWRPAIGLEEGLRDTVDWWKSRS